MTQLELAALPVAERLRLMEDLWNSLSEEAEVVPAWHQQVLDVRSAQLDAGLEPASDWADAKARLRNRAVGE